MHHRILECIGSAHFPGDSCRHKTTHQAICVICLNTASHEVFGRPKVNKYFLLIPTISHIAIDVYIPALSSLRSLTYTVLITGGKRSLRSKNMKLPSWRINSINYENVIVKQCK